MQILRLIKLESYNPKLKLPKANRIVKRIKLNLISFDLRTLNLTYDIKKSMIDNIIKQLEFKNIKYRIGVSIANILNKLLLYLISIANPLI